jgi:hypothetical protein
MPRTEEVTAYYIRTQDGECFYVDTLAEALEEFLGDKGYRVTFASPTKELVLRRTSIWGTGFTPLGEVVASAAMTYRDKEK